MSVYRAPLLDLTMPVPKEATVVEPLLATTNCTAPVELATVKMLVEGRVDVPWTYKVEVGAEVPTPTKPLALTAK